MYHETYEEYIRSILGYPNYGMQDPMMPNRITSMQDNQSNEMIEACYPEIYKVVYPMVNKACCNITAPVTPELIEKLTNEIYLSVESDNEINVTINLNNEVGTKLGNRSSNVAETKKEYENRGEDRQFRNRGLQDLIRILLIRELLRRPGRPGNRPPMPPNRPPMMRPPFPPMGGPGNMMPRYQDFSDIYEV